MKKVHGTFSSFQDLGAAMGVKAAKVEEKPRKCSVCGGTLHRCGNSNVLACDFSKLEDKELPDGTKVQVFSKCGNIVIETA